jgi:hypothetical protein
LATQRYASGVELGEMQAHNIVLAHEFGCQEAKSGHDDALADPKEHRRSHDPHAVHRFVAWELLLVL